MSREVIRVNGSGDASEGMSAQPPKAEMPSALRYFGVGP
jgi:hypothetical protein